MYVKRLSLTNFRNYVRLDLELPPGLILLQGDNAQGKTNLLEAIYYLATTRSPHADADRQLINWQAEDDEIPFARLEADVQKADRLHRVEIALLQTSAAGGTSNRLSKQIKVNGVKRRALDLIGQVNVVIFSPQDIDLIAGSPSLRRRYLDVTICQIDPRYCQALQLYNKILTQRNSLLRQLRERGGSPSQLAFWNQKLTDNGAYLLARRQEIVAALNNIVEGIHLQLTSQGEQLRLLYQSTLSNETTTPSYQLPLTADRAALDRERIAASFRARLKELQTEEMARGMTLVGPHRDDLRFIVNSKDMTIYGSRGQQRTIALSLRQAEAELMRAETGEQPILLLDEVMSELDEFRRHHLTQMIDQHQQVILTTTDLSDYRPEFLEQVLLLRVQEGRIERVNY